MKCSNFCSSKAISRNFSTKVQCLLLDSVHPSISNQKWGWIRYYFFNKNGRNWQLKLKVISRKFINLARLFYKSKLKILILSSFDFTYVDRQIGYWSKISKISPKMVKNGTFCYFLASRENGRISAEKSTAVGRFETTAVEVGAVDL